ncbi:cupredoxin domain-containing protein [Oceanibaculum indicum]|uniref:Putative cupredoxin-like copper-binding protein n=1 Tax=Oceanibaculum indicum TaxID=526216 RepID=A0A420WHQ9_9PROT|nr:cupredoxin domain-containing protein [Oceanibaculum indicum]RKQ70541.1 putative cupredoxin-like copper-binding protein [Oceanibaculum indicum]
MRSFKTTAFAAALTASALMPLAPLQAAPGHSGGHGHGHGSAAIGEPGKAAEASRTVTIVMGDNYYEPERIEVSAGETIRFIVQNKGEFLHEFNIATPEMHAAHQKEMAVMFEHGMLTPTRIDHEMMKMDHSKMGMSHSRKHDDPNSVLLEPGQSGELVWKFPSSGTLEFACNIPGHYETGMVGAVQFRAGSARK